MRRHSSIKLPPPIAANDKPPPTVKTIDPKKGTLFGPTTLSMSHIQPMYPNRPNRKTSTCWVEMHGMASVWNTNTCCYLGGIVVFQNSGGFEEQRIAIVAGFLPQLGAHRTRFFRSSLFQRHSFVITR